MLNLNKLEDQWLKYKIKSYIPYLSIFIAIIVITFIIISFTSNDIKPTTEINPKSLIQEAIIKENKVITEEKKVTIKKPLTEEVIKVIQTNKTDDKIIISPSLNFIRVMKNNSPRYYSQVKKVDYLAKKSNTNDIVEDDIEIEEIQIETINKSKFEIKRQTTHNDIQHVIKRFKKSNNPSLSLFAAKKYYLLKNYTQAYNYALITNEIDNNIEESWIVFAKSLVKLNKKSKAITTLNSYISHSHSNKAKILLDNIKSGKFR